MAINDPYRVLVLGVGATKIILLKPPSKPQSLAQEMLASRKTRSAGITKDRLAEHCYVPPS